MTQRSQALLAKQNQRLAIAQGEANMKATRTAGNRDCRRL